MKAKKIGFSYNAQILEFKKYIPDLQIIQHPRQVKDFDLIIFPGGEDVDPGRYGERNIWCQGTNGNRDDFESGIFHEAYERNKKILGICRGSQLLNTFFGGSLYQDLLEQATGYHDRLHDLNWKYDDDLFYKFFGNKKLIVSTHHQGLKKVTGGLEVLATHKSIPEVTRGLDGRLYMLQFHPEFQAGNEDFFKFISEEW